MTEANEISDKAIMAGTSVEAQPSSGRIRFVTKLPSGRALESEWVQESDKTKGVLRWCEAVKAEIVADSAAAEEERKQKVLTARKSRKVLAPAPTAEQVSPLIFPSVVEPSAGTASDTTAAPNLVSDPSAFLDGSLKNAEAAEQYWREQFERAERELGKASANLKKWKLIKEALGTS